MPNSCRRRDRAARWPPCPCTPGPGAAAAERVAPRNTAKETRAALIAHIGTGTYVHPAARFALTEAELAGTAQTRPATAYDAEMDAGEDGGGELDEHEAVPDDADGQDEVCPGEQDEVGVDDGAASVMPPSSNGLASYRPAA